MGRSKPLSQTTMNQATEELQRNLCAKYGVEFIGCAPGSKVGLALSTLGRVPINGLRHPPTADSNGWYIWAGEWSTKADFFAPLHTFHLEEQLPQVLEFLGLAPGSRFLLADDHVDVWFDKALLNVDSE